MDARNEPPLQMIRGGTAPQPGSPSAPGGVPPFVPARDALSDNLTLGDLSLLEGIGQTPLITPREPLGARIAAFLGRYSALLFVLSLVACWAIVTLPMSLSRPYKVGDHALRDVLAPYTLTLLDREETDTRRKEAAALVPVQYAPNPSAHDVALSKLRSATQKTRELKRWRALRWELVTRAAQSGVRAVYLNTQAQVRSDVADDLRSAANRARVAVVESAIALSLTTDESRVAYQLARGAARVPNLVVDERETNTEKRNAQRRVPLVYEQIAADMPIVRAGEEITPETLERLDAIEAVPSSFHSPIALANALLCLLLLGTCAASVRTFSPHLLSRPASLWLAAVVPVFFLLLFRVLLRLPHADLTMAPLAATAAMLLTILIDARVGLMGGTLVAALCALLAHAEVGLFLTSTITAWLGSLCVRDITRSATLVRAAALMALAGGLLSSALCLLRGISPDEMASAALSGAILGAVSVGATTVLALLLERPFGLTTHLRLLELSAPDEDVLKRMQTEAPGTYTHSLMVATLAEAAAKKVGADALLCRVGGLYHDVGKLRRPHCFIENQHGDNIHDRLSPQLSALVILAHVKDGLHLGRSIKLPDPILNIITQHHGTGLITYFYNRACNACNDSRTPDPDNFRYPGPKPQSKETALIMLADSIEASARALPDPQPEHLRTHIRDMIALRLREGELSECELTLRDLSTVEDEFVRVLRGAFHGRIAYPERETGDKRHEKDQRRGKDQRQGKDQRPKRAADNSDTAQARAWVKDTVRGLGGRLPRTEAPAKRSIQMLPASPNANDSSPDLNTSAQHDLDDSGTPRPDLAHDSGDHARNGDGGHDSVEHPNNTEHRDSAQRDNGAIQREGDSQDGSALSAESQRDGKARRKGGRRRDAAPPSASR